MTIPTATSTQPGQPRRAKSPAGRNPIAAAAAMDDSSQFMVKATAVNPRFAVRRPFLHGLATNIGTSVSMSALAAMTVKMMLTFVRNSRVVMQPLLARIVGGRLRSARDEILIFASDAG